MGGVKASACDLAAQGDAPGGDGTLFLPYEGSAQPPASHHKDAQDTAVAVYHELREGGTLDRCKRLVLESLDSYLKNHNAPTARELHREMHLLGLVEADPKSIKPRITELKKEGLVEFAANRLCAVTGKTVNTVRFSMRGSLLLEHLRRERRDRDVGR